MRKLGLALLLLLMPAGGWVRAGAQVVPDRVAQIDAQAVAALPGSANPHVAESEDAGRVAPGTKLAGITIYFKPSAVQQAELNALVKAQQTKGSAAYHRWLTPAQYAAEFGLSSGDLARVQTWLEQQGFAVERTAASHSSITFSGTVGQAEAAFGTEIHTYIRGSETHFANATQLTIPAALAGVVQSVRNLDDYRPRPMVRVHAPVAKPAFTSSQGGAHYLQPGDVATIYDIQAAYAAGETGTGQSIAVVGQSEISVSDIENFQKAAGLTVKDPTLVLEPGSGTAAVSSGDEVESDLDLEYSGGIAPGATVYLVYVGNNSNYSVFDSLQYAVDTDVAPIISMSYGACEADLGTSSISTLESILEQGASQGQSIVVAAGDDGSTACYEDVSMTSKTVTAAEEAVGVNYPASSAYATALGGTEFPAADVSTSNTTYWDAASGSDVVTSAKSYIPEQVWNDDSASYGAQYGAYDALSAGGGGVSTVVARPGWQTGVPGIAAGAYRLVPDLSLDASPNNAGYLYCSSDTKATGITGSCANGFRDSNDDYLTVAGGTSFAAPIFAGMLAIVNQKENSAGQGLINPTLYTLAADSSTYASAFHDITSGGNECTAGSTYCSAAGEANYSADTGYDEASGLGSVDFYNLLNAWTTGNSASLETTTTGVSAASSTPSAGASDVITITVAPQSSAITTTPTGTLTIKVDGTTETSSLALTNGAASYTFSSSTTGAHVIEANYSGDATFAASSGTLTVNVGSTSGTSSQGSFTLTATNVTVAQGSQGTSTVTISPKNAYTGTVKFTLSTTDTALETDGCYSIGNSDSEASVTTSSAVASTLTIYTSEAACSAMSASRPATVRRFTANAAVARAGTEKAPGRGAMPYSAAIAGVLMLGLGARRRKMYALLGAAMMLTILAVLPGCGTSSNGTSNSGASSSTATDVPKGTYMLTVDGTDTVTASISASATLTIVVD